MLWNLEAISFLLFRTGTCSDTPLTPPVSEPVSQQETPGENFFLRQFSLWFSSRWSCIIASSSVVLVWVQGRTAALPTLSSLQCFWIALAFRNPGAVMKRKVSSEYLHVRSLLWSDKTKTNKLLAIKSKCVTNVSIHQNCLGTIQNLNCLTFSWVNQFNLSCEKFCQ